MGNSSRTIFFLFLSLFAVTASSQELHKYTHEVEKMGTTFRFVYFTSDSITGKQALHHAVAKIDTLNAIFSDYDESSELHQLSLSSGQDDTITVSDDLWNVLSFAQELAELSDGAFDITVGPISKLWRRAFRRQEFPDVQKLNVAKALVNYQNLILLSENQVLLTKKNMRLDLGGIAKGYTVDELYNVFKSYGISRVMIDGGGDIFAGMPPANKSHWQVQTSTVSTSNYLPLNNSAIACSGDTYKYLEWNNKRYSHIIDPRTGYGVMDKDPVYIHADNCMTADALASLASIMEYKEIKELVNDMDDVQLLIDQKIK